MVNHFLPHLSNVHGRLEQYRKASYYLIQSGILPIPYLQIWFGTLCQVVLNPADMLKCNCNLEVFGFKPEKLPYPLVSFINHTPCSNVSTNPIPITRISPIGQWNRFNRQKYMPSDRPIGIKIGP